ncbi:hypothetical protein HYW42_05550 [Candidatus Daviesbacteria bacterium]|nr:hypothetical protein [Candidatus Daviesbacteria bacterium]
MLERIRHLLDRKPSKYLGGAEQLKIIEASGAIDLLKAMTDDKRKKGDATATVLEHRADISGRAIVAAHWELRDLGRLSGSSQWESKGAGVEIGDGRISVRYTEGPSWGYVSFTPPWELKASVQNPYAVFFPGPGTTERRDISKILDEESPIEPNLVAVSRSGQPITVEELTTLRRLRKYEEVPLADQLSIAAKLAMPQPDYRYGEGSTSSRGRLDTKHYRVLY